MRTKAERKIANDLIRKWITKGAIVRCRDIDRGPYALDIFIQFDEYEQIICQRYTWEYVEPMFDQNNTLLVANPQELLQ